MLLVLCGADDIDAVWAATGLRRGGPSPVEVVLPEELVVGSVWEHEVIGGRASTDVALADGRVLATRELTGVLNRLVEVPPGSLGRLPDGDRPYALEEFTALFSAWLLSLPCPVLNPPSPACLIDWRRSAEWRVLAAGAGLPAAPWRAGSRDRAGGAGAAVGDPRVHRVLVAGGVVVGDAPAEVAAALGRLAATSGVALFEARFGAGWELHDIDTRPALHSWGPEALVALASVLGGAK